MHLIARGGKNTTDKRQLYMKLQSTDVISHINRASIQRKKEEKISFESEMINKRQPILTKRS